MIPEVKQSSIETEAQVKTTVFKPEGLRQAYPRLNAQWYWSFSEGVNVLIDDVEPYRINPRLSRFENILIGQLAKSMNKDLALIDGSNLTDYLIKSLEAQRSWFKENSVAVLFPGRGAEVVQAFIKDKNQGILGPNDDIFSFEAYKVFSPDDRYERVEINLPDELISRLIDKRYDAILVIDDAIVTGETLRTIQSEIYDATDAIDDSNYDPMQRFSFPEVARLPLTFSAVAWVCCDPTKRPRDFRESSPSSVDGYSRINTAIIYSGVGKRGIVPMNSLSTLLRGDEKAQIVLDGYQKYVVDQKEFSFQIGQLSQLVNFERDPFYDKSY